MIKLIRNFNDTEVKTAIRDVKDGLIKYKTIMELFRNTDVSKDISFQRKYKGFYRMRFFIDDSIVTYFNFLEKYKNINPKPTFINTLTYFFEVNNKFQYSFVSKLLATLDPELPVWDQNVLSLFGKKNPGNWLPKGKKIEEANEIYNKLIEWYKHFLTNKEGCNWEKFFDGIHPNSNITPTKKVDFVLWQLGAKIKKNKNGKANP